MNQPGSYSELPLLPHQFRYVGYILLPVSLASGWLYLFGGRPATFEIPVFAVVSSYVETRWLVLAQTNILDEVAVVTLLTGLLFVAFSNEVCETDLVQKSRMRTLVYSIYSTTGICVIVYLTVYGWPAAVLFSAAFAIFLVIYIVLFRLSLLKIRVGVQHQQKRQTLNKGAL